jgi:hypothetical protein
MRQEVNGIIYFGVAKMQESAASRLAALKILNAEVPVLFHIENVRLDRSDAHRRHSVKR